jgi:hypothetical protein
MSHPVHSYGRISTRIRRIAGPLVLASTLGAGAFGATPAAFASPVSSVRSHTRCADVALHAVTSAAAKGNVSVALGTLTSQLDAAAKISAKLAVHAQTPSAEQVAAGALKIVAREEAKAEMQLTAAAATVASTKQSAIVHAAVSVADARELALSSLAKLAAQANAGGRVSAHVLAKELATLTADGKGLLENLAGVVAKIDGSVSANVSPSAIAELAATETADVSIDLGRIESLVSLLSGRVRAEISALSDTTAQLAGQIDGQAATVCGCQPASSSSVGVSLSGQALTSASASALAAVPGAIITDATSLIANLTGSATFEVDITTSTGATETITEDSNYGVLSVTGAGSISSAING